jgi:hypothetical protein
MESLRSNTSNVDKSSFAEFHHSLSDSNLNYTHYHYRLKTKESNSYQNQKYKNISHKCVEGLIKVVSYEQFIKLVKYV